MKVTIRGEVFEVTPESWDFWGLVDRGEWEPETFAALDRYLTPETDCLDVGAWVGPITLYASRKARRVYALEPDPAATMNLLANLALNDVALDKVRVLHAALGAADEWRGFGAPSFLGDSKGGLDINPIFLAPAVSFAALLRVVSMETLGFIKMDIEGGEEFVLPSMTQVLCGCKPTLLVSLHPSGYVCPGPMVDVLGLYPYRYTVTGEPLDVWEIKQRVRDGENFTVLATEQAWT
jgi:FkbM family methyltransferase